MNSYQDPMNPQLSSGTMGDQRYYIMLPGLDGATYSTDELRAMAAAKVIRPSTPVQPEGWAYVIPASCMPGVYSDKSRIVALLLALSLGLLAIDRFYMGRVGLGVLKLLVSLGTLGLGGFIWWFIDIIMIATRTARPGDGLPLGD